MNAESFDPYHKWLGIRPEEQPANHYRLLALGLFEDDADAIANAADQRMLLVRSFQTGRSSAVSQKLLNEITAAKLCLLSPEKKAAYDEQLRAELGTQVGPEEPAGAVALDDVGSPEGVGPLPEVRIDTGVQPAAKRSGSPAALLAAGGAVALVLVVALVWIVAGSGSLEPAAPHIVARDRQKPVAPPRRAPVPQPPPRDDRNRIAPALPAAADPPGPPEPREPRPEGTTPPPAVAPFDAEEARRHQEAWADYLGIPVQWENSIGMKFVLIPLGEFMMGSPEDEVGRFDNEGPQHRVRITKPFYLGKYPVTQDQWEQVMGRNPSHFKGPRNPVEEVRWSECQTFVRKLSESARHPRQKFRLATEAEWEYACRAGTTTRFSFGDEASQLDQYAWYDRNSGRQTHPVGQKRPNAWGLHDMHGNVWEWCADWFDAEYYATSPTDDPPGGAAASHRVIRGGSWGHGDSNCRAANRYCFMPGLRYRTLGVRVAFDVPEMQATPEPVAEAHGTPSKVKPDEETAEAGREPIPSSSEQQEVRRAIDDLYDTAAARKPDEALELADKLAALAEKSKDGTERFVLQQNAQIAHGTLTTMNLWQCSGGQCGCLHPTKDSYCTHCESMRHFDGEARWRIHQPDASPDVLAAMADLRKIGTCAKDHLLALPRGRRGQ